MIPSPNDPNEVLAYLSEPIRHYRDGLDHGVSMADSFIGDQRFCPHTWAAAARYGARNYLHDVLSENAAAEWELRELPNCGLEVVRSPFVVRGLKAQDDGPPSPGRNPRRRKYWNQFQLMTLFDDNEPKAGANLILDWAVDNQRSVVLALSKTQGTWAYKGAPKIEWRQPVAFDEQDQATFVSADEEVDVQPKFDAAEYESGQENA